MRYRVFSRRTRLSRRIRVVHAPSQAAACAVAQQEIFNDKLAVAIREVGQPTGTTGYVMAGSLWSSFDFDDVIQHRFLSSFLAARFAHPVKD